MTTRLTIAGQTEEWALREPASVQAWRRYSNLMLRELASNDEKGNRRGWLQMDAATAVGETLYHVGKLSVAVRQVHRLPDPRLNLTTREVIEYAADVGNCSMMVLDTMGLLA